MDNQSIKFNVGGQTFETKKIIFNNHPDSFLAKLCKDIKLDLSKDINEAIFIDRDGDYFQSILDFHLYKKVTMTVNMTIQGLYEEAKFFEIDDLIKYCENEINIIKSKSIKLKFLDESLTVKIDFLTSESEYFEKLLDNLDMIDSLKDKNGCFFFGKRAKYFKIILKYYETHSVEVFKPLEKSSLDSFSLSHHIDFFGFKSLKDYSCSLEKKFNFV